jgi:hypothetical protein
MLTYPAEGFEGVKDSIVQFCVSGPAALAGRFDITAAAL